MMAVTMILYNSMSSSNSAGWMNDIRYFVRSMKFLKLSRHISLISIISHYLSIRKVTKIKVRRDLSRPT